MELAASVERGNEILKEIIKRKSEGKVYPGLDIE